MRYECEELETFLEHEPALRAEHDGEWVLISGREIIGVFESRQAATEIAVAEYHQGSFLLRQIGAANVEGGRAKVA